MSATSPPQPPEGSFAETALTLGGKSEDEARRTGTIDRADDQVEQLFRPEYQTVNSPAHRAVWDHRWPVELFLPTQEAIPADVQQVMDASVEVVRRHQAAETIYGEDGKASEAVLRDLGQAGYWGLLVGREYGGMGVSMRSFSAFLTRMAAVDPTIAGLASVHGCIGAVDPVKTFGSEEQKRRWFPKLASGERLSAFALTEPGAGSDLTALSTRAVREGDEFVVTGEKLFITNVVPGRTIGLVCLIENKPAVLVVDLPDQENEQFQLVKYGLYALKHTYNRGIKFNGLRVPASNLLNAPKGNGLTIAYHGLNLGRIALCANAAGTMRIMLASMIPWAQFRHTYGEAIARRELVRRRLARLAGMIVGADALVAWCSTLLDAGYRGEMECIVAKIFGSEALKEAAIELCMKTHGGRAFLHGHLFGDNVHEYLAPCIYEGEGEMLSMAFFKSLVKQHGTQFFEAIGKALHQAGIKKLNPMNPAHVWALRTALPPYLKWLAAERLRSRSRPHWPSMPEKLRRHADFAADRLQRSALEISAVMRKYQLKLADRQGRMVELSQRTQHLLTILCTSLYASQQADELVRDAADILCQDLTTKLTGARPTDAYFRAANQLGEKIADGQFASLKNIEPSEILMRY
jgi:alkylation response protein AidB-like acyl-CoA dehydrogenase